MSGNNGAPAIRFIGERSDEVEASVAAQCFAVGMQRLGHGIDRVYMVHLYKTIVRMDVLRQEIEVSTQFLARCISRTRSDLTEAAALIEKMPTPPASCDEFRKLRALILGALGGLL